MIALIREYGLIDPNAKTPEEAWGEVVKEKNRAFIYADRKIEDPLAEESVKIMGWRNLCLSENEIADRAHFFKIYTSLLQKRREKKILGIHEEQATIEKNPELEIAKETSLSREEQIELNKKMVADGIQRLSVKFSMNQSRGSNDHKTT